MNKGTYPFIDFTGLFLIKILVKLVCLLWLITIGIYSPVLISVNVLF